MCAALLPANLKALRKLSNLSQTKFSELIELEQKRYAKWEEGRCQPDIDSIIKIASTHKVSIDDLLMKNLS